MSLFSSISKIAKKTKGKIEEKLIQKKVEEANAAIKTLGSLQNFIEINKTPNFPTVTEDNVTEVLNTLRSIGFEKIIQQAEIAKERISDVKLLLAPISSTELPKQVIEELSKYNTVTLENVSEAESFAKAANTIIQANIFIQDYSTTKSMEFKAINFFKRYKASAHKMTQAYMNNPNILSNLGMANMFGGAIGTAYAAQSLINIATSSYTSAAITSSAEAIRFYRDFNELENSEKTAILTAYCLKEEGKISSRDFWDAFYSFVWNDSECMFSNIGKKSTGAFSQIILDDNNKISLAIATKIISENIISKDQFNSVVASKSNELHDLTKQYLSNLYPA